MTEPEVFTLSDDDEPVAAVPSAPSKPSGYVKNDDEIIMLDDSPQPAPAKQSRLHELNNDGIEFLGVSPAKAIHSLTPACPAPRMDRREALFNRLEELDRNIALISGQSPRQPINISSDAAAAPVRTVSSDGDSQERRRKRTREEIEEEKAAKQREREEKNRARREKKDADERSKQSRKIEREMAASLNSKVEQHMYCHIGNGAVKVCPELFAAAKVTFLDRGVDEQLVFEGDDENTRIEWHRKAIELVDDGDGPKRFEFTILQSLFCVVVPSSTVRELILSESFSDLVAASLASFPIHNTARLVVIAYGELKVPEGKMLDFGLELFEHEHTQLRVCETPEELALYIAQLTRSLAKTARRDGIAASHSTEKLLVDIDKGISSGPGLVRDWWDKMLAGVFRLHNEQRRTILNKIPDPFRGMDWLNRVGYAQGVTEIADLVSDNGRRIGPMVAHRIVCLLTDHTGANIIE